VTDEDWAIHLLGYAAADLERAAAHLSEDADTRARIKQFVEQVDRIYWQVHERDRTRRFRRFLATGTDPTHPIA